MRPVTLLACLALASAVVTAPRAACVPPPSGIVGFWPADGAPTDVVGGAPTELYYGADYTTLSIVGPGFWFRNGSTNLVYVTPTDAQRVSTGMTVEGWIYFQPIQVPCGEGDTCTSLQNATIAASGPVDGVNPLAWQLVVRIPDPGHFGGTPEERAAQALAHREVVFAVRRSNGTFAATSTIFAMATPDWMHVAATYDASSGVIALYVNGGFMTSASAGPGNVGTAHGDTMFFGVLPFNSNYVQPFQGAMDEMALYDRALGGAEIASIVNAWTDGKCFAGRGGGGGSTCYTAGSVTACASSWTEGPSGFYLASGNIEIGPQGSPYFAVRNGEVKIGPASGSLSWKGTFVVPTYYGDIPLYSTQGSSRWGVPTTGAWTPDEFNGTFTRLLEGLPAFTSGGLSLNNLPFASVPQFGMSVDLGSGCVSGTPSYSFSGLPEGGSFSADGWFSICADTLAPQAGVSNLDVNVAGCSLRMANGTLWQVGDDLGFMAREFGLTLPLQGSAFRANARDLFVSARGVNVGGGELSLPPLSLGPFKIGYANASIYPRTVGGYRVCGNAGFDFPVGPAAGAGANISFALLGGELQRGCVSGSFGALPIIPGLPVFITRLGGCVTLPTSTTLYAGEECNAESFYSDSGCLTGDCNLGVPEVALTTAVVAGVPGGLPGFPGYPLSADPVTLAFGPSGFRASADVQVLGNYFGTGEICVAAPGGYWQAEMCAAVDVGGQGAITGQCNVWIGDEGITGSFNACVHFQQRCIGWHCWDDPTDFSASVNFGRFRVRKLFGTEEHFGLTAGVSACEGCNGGFSDCWPSATVGFDVRTGSFHWSGIEPLPRGSGVLARAQLAEGDRAFGPFAVPPGAKEILFLADTDGAALDVTVDGPDGELSEGSEDVRVEKHDAEGITIFGVTAPSAGSWSMTVHGTTPEMVVEGEAFTEAEPATVEPLTPAVDTDAPLVSWNGTLKSTSAETTLSVIAAPDDTLAAQGVGRVIHQETLVAGPSLFEIPAGTLEEGTWSIVLRLDDGLGHVSHVVAPGRLIVIDDEAPQPPAFAEAISIPGGARVRWQPSPSPDVARYDVIHQATADGNDEVVTPAGGGLSHDVTGLMDGETRRLFVRAVDRSGNASGAVEAGVAGADATSDGTPPEVPAGLVVAATSDSSLRAEWDAVAGAAAYRVRFGIDASLGGAGAAEGMSPMDVPGTSLDLSGFDPGTRIFLAVAAVDAAGNVGALSDARDVLLTSGADTDGDGLPDDWERLWFSSLQTTSGQGDTDGDWLDDLFEFEAGTDPLIRTPFSWGDLAPAGAFDGEVDISDAVRALRLSLELEPTDQDTLRRAEVSPAEMLRSGRLRPTRAEPMRTTVADVVLILRAAVDLSEFERPFAP